MAPNCGAVRMGASDNIPQMLSMLCLPLFNPPPPSSHPLGVENGRHGKRRRGGLQHASRGETVYGVRHVGTLVLNRVLVSGLHAVAEHGEHGFLDLL